MKVLIINSHPRAKSALDTLVNEIGTGAVEAGADVEQIRLAEVSRRPGFGNRAVRTG